MYVDVFSYLGDACNYDLLFSSQEMGHYESRSIPDCGMSILRDAHNHHLLPAFVCRTIWIGAHYGCACHAEGETELFDNDIAGQMQFRMSDRPIDTPSQWGNNWRLYWFGVFASTVAWIGGIISIIVLFMNRLYIVWKKRNEKVPV